MSEILITVSYYIIFSRGMSRTRLSKCTLLFINNYGVNPSTLKFDFCNSKFQKYYCIMDIYDYLIQVLLI